MRAFTCTALAPLSLLLAHAAAVIHQQVSFDSSDVCWWGFVPPDLTCPVLSTQNLADAVDRLKSQNQWDGGDRCESDFCLYSNKAFAGGRGIAVITTPENLEKVKRVGVILQDYNVSFSNDPESLPYHVGNIEAKGEAVIADTPLKRGDPIMAHTPVLLVHHAFQHTVSAEKQQIFFDLALNSLPKATADMFVEKMLPTAQQQQGLHLLGISAVKVDLNGRDDVNGRHYGAFPEATKLSHDCRPNAASYVDLGTLMHISTAARIIEPGEPITLSYLDPFANHEKRTESARAAWGHKCPCHQCNLPEDEASDSETRLREIRWIEDKMEDANSVEVSPGLITYLLGLYENENLHCCLAKPYAHAAFNYNRLGHDKHAVRYAELAIEALEMERGVGAPEALELAQLRNSPKQHHTWKTRVVSKRN